MHMLSFVFFFFTVFLQQHKCYETSATFSNLVASHLIPGTKTLQTQFLEILMTLGDTRIGMIQMFTQAGE